MSERLLSNRIAQLSESATLRMSALARAYKAKGFDVISLSIGEPDFDTPQHIKQFAKQALDDGFTKYTPVPGLPVLKEAIQKKFKRDNGLDYDLDQIVVSNGAKQTISNLVNALINPGDEVVLITPFWVSYNDITELAGGKVVQVRTEPEDGFKIHKDRLEQAITARTKMIIFSSPGNPSGVVYGSEDLDKIAEVLRANKDIIAVSDEIYEFINYTEKHLSLASYDDIKHRVVTVNGFAKGFAMTGWRLGYMGAPSWLAKACAKAQGQCTSGANAFAQKAAAEALLADLGPTYAMRDAFLKRRDLMMQHIESIPGMHAMTPDGAFYVFPDVSHYFGSSDGNELIQNSEDMSRFLIEDAHVATVAGKAFGEDRCIRISYAASDEQLNEAMDRIKKALSKLS